jgi:fibronectin-binding autotransporter adhesin
MPDRYWVGGTANWDGTAGTKWSSTSGGAGGATAPTASDDVYFDVGSGTGTCSLAASVACRSLFFSGSTNGVYAGTFNTSQVFTLTVNVAGGTTASFFLSPSATYVGTGSTITLNGGTGTLRSSNVIWPARLNFGRQVIYNISGSNWTNLSPVSASISSNNITIINGNNLICSGGFFVSNTRVSGSSKIILAGGVLGNTVTNSIATGYISNDTDLAGNITIGSVRFAGRTGGTVVRYVSGVITVPLTGSSGAAATQSFTETIAPLTLDTGTNVVWVNPVIETGTTNGIFILASDMYTTGTVTLGSTGTNNIQILSGSNSIFVSGNLNLASTAGEIYTLTNTTVRINGPGTFTHNGRLNAFNLVFNAGAQVFTISSATTFNRTGGTITYTSGQIVTTGTTLALQLGNGSSFVFNTAGMSWNNVTTANTLTYTINSNLSISGSLTLGGTSTFAGPSEWTCNTLNCTTAGTTITLQSGSTYTTTNATTLTGTAGNPIIYKGSATTPRAIWTLNQGATQDIGFVNGQYIDSSLGQTIWSYKGVLTDTLNWATGSQLPTVGFISIN